ncbi:hypothetical protein B0H14DRAFT_2955596 [Mycena olivaceomarginata]|nr:hypothetical protein B0H14DRAFT_2955596 [Mycena olivaceomarginata]
MWSKCDRQQPQTLKKPQLRIFGTVTGPIMLTTPSGEPNLPDFQNQQELEGQVLSLCVGFFREIEALLKNTDPSVVAQSCPANVLQMLNDVKRRSDILLDNLMRPLPPVVPTISRLNGERDSKRRRQTDVLCTGSSPFEAVSSRKPPKQAMCRSCGGLGHYLKTCSKTTITRRITGTSNTKLGLIGSENGLSAGSVTQSSVLDLQHSHPTRCDNVTLGFDTSNDVAHPRERVEIQVMEPAEKTIDFDQLKRQRALDGAQAAAMLEALSRICQVSCGWQGCRRFEFVRDLVTHLYVNHMQECIQPSSSPIGTTHEHIDSHVLETIHCGYQELVEHNLRHREQRTALKPSTRPTPPAATSPPRPSWVRTSLRGLY